MNDERAREMVTAGRARIEGALRELTSDVRAEGALVRQQTGEAMELDTDLETEGVEMAIVRNLRTQLEAVGRAEERILAGIYGRSIQSGATISDDRLEAEPLAERTIQEQRAFERLRASQLNGCAHYVDVHTKDARATVEDEQRLHLVAVWREAPFFTSRERAALAWTEELTLLPSTDASDEPYEAMAQESSRRPGPVAVT